MGCAGSQGPAAHQKRQQQQIGNAADLLRQLHPAGGRRGRLPFSRRRKKDIGDIDQHGQRKDRKADPRKGKLQIHNSIPAFTANSGSLAGLP